MLYGSLPCCSFLSVWLSLVANTCILQVGLEWKRTEKRAVNRSPLTFDEVSSPQASRCFGHA